MKKPLNKRVSFWVVLLLIVSGLAAGLSAEEQENLAEGTTQSSVLPDIQQEAAEIEIVSNAVPAKAETPADTLVELETIESSQPAKESVSDVHS